MTETKNTKAFYNTEIPSDWEVKRFEQICDKLLDGTHFSPKSKQGPFKYITSKNVRNEGLDLGNLGHISEEEHRAIYKRCPVKYGDILLTKDGAGTGACCQNTLLEEFSLLSSVAVLNVKIDCTLNEYFLQYIKSPICQKIIQDAISGQAITRITLEKIKRFKIPLPPLTEQIAIAQVLSTADAAIYTTEKLIAQKELRKKWLMQQLLAGKKRLKGFVGEVKQKLVDHYIKEISERNKDLKITNVLSVTNSRGFINQADQFDRVVASEDATNYKIVRKGQFAYNPSRINVGSLDLLRNFESGILSPMYVVFETDKSQLLPDYFYYQLKTQWFYGHIPMFVQGSVRDSLSFDGLCSMKFFIPSIEEQIAIAQVLQAADKEISLLKAKAEKLREQKKGLMQQLLTGKKRLLI